MVTATLRTNLGPPTSKQKDDSCLQEDQEPSQNAQIFVSCQADVVNKQLFFNLVEITFCQKESLTVWYLSKETLWDICLQDIIPVNGLKTSYIDIKPIERVKKQTV